MGRQTLTPEELDRRKRLAAEKRARPSGIGAMTAEQLSVAGKNGARARRDAMPKNFSTPRRDEDEIARARARAAIMRKRRKKQTKS